MNKYKLPKPYLSYSAWQLWKSNKDEYRRRYYLNEKPFETAETIFGKSIAQHLEDGGKIKDVITPEKAEHKITVTIDEDLHLLGYLDGFDPETLTITEFKTGHLSKDGKVPWDNVKVKRHKQLDFYSLLVNEKYGKFNPYVTLQWMETEFVKKKIIFDGHELVTDSKELRLTGKVKTFKRRILKREIAKIKDEIIKVALEITNDYETWTKMKSVNTSVNLQRSLTV